MLFVTDFLGIGQLSVDSNMFMLNIQGQYIDEAQSSRIPALFGFPCERQFEKRKRSCFAPPRDWSVCPVTSVRPQA